MKSILVLRHGKSDWSAGFDSDHDRPLAPRGIHAAKLMGRFLTGGQQEPEKILSSTAVRARSTADLAVATGAWSCPISYLDTLYGASAGMVLDLIQTEDDSVSSLMLVGHQPTWTELIAGLTGGTAVRFPTAALARIDFEIGRWRDVQWGEGTLRYLVTPKLLEKGKSS